MRTKVRQKDLPRQTPEKLISVFEGFLARGIVNDLCLRNHRTRFRKDSVTNKNFYSKPCLFFFELSALGLAALGLLGLFRRRR